MAEEEEEALGLVASVLEEESVGTVNPLPCPCRCTEAWGDSQVGGGAQAGWVALQKVTVDEYPSNEIWVITWHKLSLFSKDHNIYNMCQYGTHFFLLWNIFVVLQAQIAKPGSWSNEHQHLCPLPQLSEAGNCCGNAY